MKIEKNEDKVDIMKRNNIKGFTLIELMTTVVLIGIVASMAVPRFSKAYERMEFKSANRDLTSTLRLARSMAISNKEVFGVNFDSDSKLISLFKKDTSSVLFSTFEATDSLISVDSMSNTYSTISTDVSNNTISFRPNGSAVFTGGGNIVCMAYTDNMVGISQFNILASTGRIKSEGHYY